MDFRAFSTDFAKEVDGTYDEYDEMKSVFIIPLKNGRNQTVIAEIKEHTDGREMIRVDSRICKLFSPIKYSEILSASADFIHTRFIAEDDYLKAEASFYLDNLNEAIIKEMIMEVAQVADDWELEITGEDIH